MRRHILNRSRPTLRRFSAPLQAFVCFVALIASVALHAGEALWPIQRPPLEALKKELAFEPDAKWFESVQYGCVRILDKGHGGGGSGSFISPTGLVITNRHAIVDFLGDLSTPERDLVRKGFLAEKREDELACAGLELQVLARVTDVTAQVKQDLGPNPEPGAVAQLEREIRKQQKGQGVELSLVSEFGGARFSVYFYATFQAKLVFVPDEAFGRFGGEDDNFRYPRHNLDIAILRCYRNGQPFSPRSVLALSTTPAKDGDTVFIAGHPGHTQRYLTVAELEYLRDIDLPLQAATTGETLKALEKYMGLGAEQRQRAIGSFESASNQYKIHDGALNYLKTSDLIARRTTQQAEWKKAIEAKPEVAKALGDAFAVIEASCKKRRKNASREYFTRLPSNRLFNFARSLRSFGDATRGRPNVQIRRQIQSFKGFIGQILSSPMDLNVERAALAGWLTALKKTLGAEDPFVKAALKGESPEDAAKRILLDADPLLDSKRAAELVDTGAVSLDAAKIPLLDWIKMLDEVPEPEGEIEENDNDREAATRRIQSALYAVYGESLAPDAAFSLRFGWGKVSGYKEEGRDIPWATTFQSMLDRAAAMGKEPYVVSERVAAAKAKLDLSTPLNLVSTADGCPGSSGAPLFNREGKLVGVLFDGNRQEVPSIYAYIRPEEGGRSIAVHTSAIWAALEHVYGAKALLEELRTAPK